MLSDLTHDPLLPRFIKSGAIGPFPYTPSLRAREKFCLIHSGIAGGGGHHPVKQGSERDKMSGKIGSLNKIIFCAQQITNY
jgi:hypothetical protein